MPVLLILFIFLSIIFIVMLLPLNIELRLKWGEGDPFYKLDLYLLFQPGRKRIHLSFLENKFLTFFSELINELAALYKLLLKDKEKEFKERARELDIVIRLLKMLRDKKLTAIIINNIKLSCYDFYWKTKYGFSNPALTGISNALFWTIKGSLLSIFTAFICFRSRPRVEIDPDFYNPVFTTEIGGIFSLRIGNIIITALKLMLYSFYANKLKGVNRLWGNTQLKH
ncbi:MAG TPA: DUF2953 domain-containing protein [Halanaerobiales bacterium]|nr:DUF2953 domain-containing protein [Halanaerobiales bacterium]